MEPTGLRIVMVVTNLRSLPLDLLLEIFKPSAAPPFVAFSNIEVNI